MNHTVTGTVWQLYWFSYASYYRYFYSVLTISISEYDLNFTNYGDEFFIVNQATSGLKLYMGVKQSEYCGGAGLYFQMYDVNRVSAFLVNSATYLDPGFENLHQPASLPMSYWNLGRCKQHINLYLMHDPNATNVLEPVFATRRMLLNTFKTVSLLSTRHRSLRSYNFR